MKRWQGKPRNSAAKALSGALFRQRVVCDKKAKHKAGYVKHKACAKILER